jgi:hypothetical protein
VSNSFAKSVACWQSHAFQSLSTRRERIRQSLRSLQWVEEMSGGIEVDALATAAGRGE